MQKQIESEKEALGLARNALENMATRGPWMSVSWCVECGEVFADKVSWQFPNAKLSVAIECLENILVGLKEKVEEEKPLPVAQDLPPTMLAMPQLTESVGKVVEKCPVVNSLQDRVSDSLDEGDRPYPADAVADLTESTGGLDGVVEVIDKSLET